MSIWVWAGFVALVFLMMAADLGVFNKEEKVITAKKALVNTLIWIILGLSFNVFIFFAYEHHWLGIGTALNSEPNGQTAALKFFTAYLLEEALSVDNLFVMALIFQQFRVPKKFQHKVLFWGILGVLVFRGLLIGVGLQLIERFSWLFYFFGALLIYSGLKMLKTNDEEEVGENALVKWVSKRWQVTKDYDEHGSFFVRLGDGAKAMTPLFICLLVIETTDVMFAFDSVPACFSVSTDPFIVFTSNVFAILGLRSLYFLLSNVMDQFEYLKYSLTAILVFIGLKMIGHGHIHIPEMVSLMIIAILILAGVVASKVLKK